MIDAEGRLEYLLRECEEMRHLWRGEEASTRTYTVAAGAEPASPGA